MEAQSRKIVVSFLFAMLLWNFPATASVDVPSPTAQIRERIEGTIRILNRADLRAKARKSEREELLRKEIRPAFDFGEMSRRSLGVRWRERTPEEKRKFEDIFAELLENSYLGKIETYKGEKIRFVRERVEDSYAEVNTVIVTSGQREIPIDYRVTMKEGQWRIYDVVIEGISLVGNYRAQFAAILEKSSFDELVKKLQSAVRSSRGA